MASRATRTAAAPAAAKAAVPAPATLNRSVGSVLTFDGERLKVRAVPNDDELVLEGRDGHMRRVPVDDILASMAEARRDVPKGAMSTDPAAVGEAKRWWAALGPVVENEARTAADVRAAAARLGISQAGAYRAIRRYRDDAQISSLLPPKRDGGRGKSRLDPRINKAIKEVIEDVLLNLNNFSMIKARRTIRKRIGKLCDDEGNPLQVSDTAIRVRIQKIPQDRWVRAREGREGMAKIDRLKGEHPEVLRPLQIVQIDHWLADVEILDDDRVAVVERCWLTLAIDVFSRMVYGFYLSHDAPSTNNVAMLMVMAMQRKTEIIKKHGLKMEWPICGKPETLLADNAKEFRGESLKASCSHYAINLKWRPVKKPQYGAHIERLNRTLADMLKDLPGATGSNPAEKKRLRKTRAREPIFDLAGLERHILILIDKYHNKPHTSADLGGLTPLQRWNSFFFGPNGPKRRLPEPFVDDGQLKCTWFRRHGRTIGRHGIGHRYMKYFDEGLDTRIRVAKLQGRRVWISEPPYTIRYIYLEDPDTGEWFKVWNAFAGCPDASLVDRAAALRAAKAANRRPTSKTLCEIMEEEDRNIEAQRALTRKQRTRQNRRKAHERLREEDERRAPPEAQKPSPASAEGDPARDYDGVPPAGATSARTHADAATPDAAQNLFDFDEEELKGGLLG